MNDQYKISKRRWLRKLKKIGGNSFIYFNIDEDLSVFEKFELNIFQIDLGEYNQFIENDLGIFFTIEFKLNDFAMCYTLLVVKKIVEHTFRVSQLC